MSAINANIVVEPISLNVTQSSITQTVTVEPINLGIFTSAQAMGGNIGQLQYNFNGQVLGGVPGTDFANGNLTLGANANVKLTGGTSGYFLQTDGSGNLSWNAGTSTPGAPGSPGGAATQVQYNDGTTTFAGATGFTYDIVSADVAMGANLEVFSNISTPAGIFNGDGGGLSNIQAGNVVGLSLSQIANGTSNVDIATVNGDVVVGVGGSANVASFFTGGANVNGDLNVVSDITSTSGIFTGDGAGLSNIAAANVVGLSLSQIANGTSNVNIATVDSNVKIGIGGTADVVDIGSTVTSITGDLTVASGVITGDGGGLSNISVALAQAVTNNAQPNITSVGTLTSVVVSGNANIAGTTITNLGIQTPGVSGNITGVNKIDSNIVTTAQHANFAGNVSLAPNLAISSSTTPPAATAGNTEATFKYPITINGVVYYINLTDVI